MKDFVKEENLALRKFINDFNIPQKAQSNFLNLVKRISFIQNLSLSAKDKIFEYIISDSIFLLDCINTKKHRYGYLFCRAIIENSTKYILNLKYAEKMFMKDAVDENQSLSNINLIYGIYKTSSNQIHGFDLKPEHLVENYYELSKLVSKDKEINELISNSLNVFNYFIELIIENKNDFVSEAFIRKNQLLKYLIGENNYHIFKSQKQL